MGYHRAEERNRRLKKLCDETKNSCGSGAYYDENKNRYIKCCARNTPGYAKYLRKISNRRVRKSDIPLKGCSYKRLYDYWWELY